MAIDALPLGETYGLAHGGWPPVTIVRDMDGSYWSERMTHDLRTLRREPLTEEMALAWIEADEEQTEAEAAQPQWRPGQAPY